MYTAYIDQTVCVGCGACIGLCPVGAIRMMPGWICAVRQDACIGCGACAAVCHKKAVRLQENGSYIS